MKGCVFCVFSVCGSLDGRFGGGFDDILMVGLLSVV